MKDLTGQVALVTGSSRGIGAAIARVLAADGVAVALLARNETLLDAVHSEIQSSGGTARGYRCDLTQSHEVESTTTAIERDLGPISILVNNAGFGGPFHRTDEVSDEEWELIFATNVRSAFWLCRRLLPGMRDRRYGRIVNISSVLGMSGAARSSTYAATKHALIGYTRSIAAEWAGFGITCNAICPGYIATDMVASADAADVPEASMIPVGRFGRPKEVADLVSLLVRPDSSYINGSTLTIDGGLTSTLLGTA
jgi:3-oxoacyl-[acyl-carrier protein] reductase